MNKYLLLDSGTLTPQGLDNVRLEICEMKKDTMHTPFFTEDYFREPARRWEVRIDNGYPNVIYDPAECIYRCYYTLCTYDPASANTPLSERKITHYEPLPGRITSLAYAESRDGVMWYKPALGLVSFEGNTENNLLFLHAHGTGVFLDEREEDPKKRYKLVTKVEGPDESGFMAVNFSEDGIHWGEMVPWPEHNPRADSHNFVFRDEKDGTFRLITRTWKNGVRISVMSESRDFIRWSEPVEILRGRRFSAQVYSMPVFQYEGLYLGLPSVFHEGDRSSDNFDTVDCELAFAAEPEHFDWVCPGSPVIRRGKGRYPGEFDCGCIFASAPVEIDGQMWVYYMGGNGQHSDFRESSLGRASFEQDKLAFYTAMDREKRGLLTTAAFRFFGEDLEVLAEMGEQGYLEAALCTKWNRPIEGFGYAECEILPGEGGYYKIHFKNRNIQDWGQRPVLISLRFQDCRIYAFRGALELQSPKYG